MISWAGAGSEMWLSRRTVRSYVESEHPIAVLKKMSEKYGKTWAQILVRWSLQKGFVPLPKSVTPSRIEENAKVYNFELSAEDMDELETPKGRYEPCSWDPTTSKD